MSTLAQKLLLSVSKKGQKVKERDDAVRNLQRLVWLLVRASGGKVTISLDEIANFDPKHAQITTYTDTVTRDFVYEAKDARDV